MDRRHEEVEILFLLLFIFLLFTQVAVVAAPGDAEQAAHDGVPLPPPPERTDLQETRGHDHHKVTPDVARSKSNPEKLSSDLFQLHLVKSVKPSRPRYAGPSKHKELNPVALRTQILIHLVVDIRSSPIARNQQHREQKHRAVHPQEEARAPSLRHPRNEIARLRVQHNQVQHTVGITGYPGPGEHQAVHQHLPEPGINQ